MRGFVKGTSGSRSQEVGGPGVKEGGEGLGIDKRPFLLRTVYLVSFLGRTETHKTVPAFVKRSLVINHRKLLE